MTKKTLIVSLAIFATLASSGCGDGRAHTQADDQDGFVV